MRRSGRCFRSKVRHLERPRGCSAGLSFSGTATVKVLNAFGPGVQSIFHDIRYVVAVTPGGPGVATLQLTVFGVFDGVPGDVAPANGNYDLAKEMLARSRSTRVERTRLTGLVAKEPTMPSIKRGTAWLTPAFNAVMASLGYDPAKDGGGVSEVHVTRHCFN
jgi:hypothetical protein